MSRNRKNLRNAFYRQRFYSLMIKKKQGMATLKELIELDDIVNRDPVLRKKVLHQFYDYGTLPTNDKQKPDTKDKKRHSQRQHFWPRLKKFFGELLQYKNFTIIINSIRSYRMHTHL
jgi:hypothetical protein